MITRRLFIQGSTMTTLALGIPSDGFAAGPRVISAHDARKKVQAGELFVSDIRTRQEWKQTGIGNVVLENSMHERGFLERLHAVIGEDKSTPFGLICATGGRSRFLQGELVKRGYTNVYDVAEGMMGSPAGSGWLRRGLPTRKVK